MKRELELELIRRALDNISNKTSDSAGEPFGVPVERYLSETVLAAERRLLRQRPVVVAFASQVAEPGSVVVHDHAGVPVLVTRTKDGELHAFFNACRHRGTKIALEGCSAADKLVCPYHGWSYDLSGRLRGVPHRGEFSGVDLAAKNLVELPVWTHAGLVLTRMTAGPSEDLALGALPQDLESFGFGDHVLFGASVRERPLNWKLMLDGSWETYHFRTTHDKTIAPFFFDNTGVFDWDAPNLRMVLPKRSILELRDAGTRSWHIRPHANLIYSLFPNTIVLVQPDHAMVLTLWPTAVDRTVIAAGMLVPEAPSSDKAVEHWHKNEQIFWDAIEEDLDMGARIQATLASGANPELLCGRSEHLIGKYRAELDRALFVA
ncbi:MAG: aromatic ring-hydroxylating dioxygenase subunit alpha [Myxococcales bacterium]|nr:aromatic ring-hydroxylating dioxygenase subunit alpha [Myxococcales bacterium]MCB9582071.1 aromatic ring-hydroxylating dioxygenase subunit alpha [Polyangiaceae bacterium]